MIVIDTTSETFTKTVKVRFATNNNTFREGDFKATFKRISKDRLNEMLDPDANYSQSEVLDEVLVGVSGIGKTPTEELPPEEQLAWVKNSIECCNAAFRDFFTATRQADGDAKTSRKRG